jgi:hypothetical protein
MSTVDPIPSLTSGRLLARNTIWNLLGQLLPMAVGVVAIPRLVRSTVLACSRWHGSSLAYFSLFDLGMGRALKLVADKIGSNDEASIPPLVWTSLFLMLLLRRPRRLYHTGDSALAGFSGAQGAAGLAG